MFDIFENRSAANSAVKLCRLGCHATTVRSHQNLQRSGKGCEKLINADYAKKDGGLGAVARCDAGRWCELAETAKSRTLSRTSAR